MNPRRRCRTHSRIPATAVPITGQVQSIASTIASRVPSARDGSTSALGWFNTSKKCVPFPMTRTRTERKAYAYAKPGLQSKPRGVGPQLPFASPGCAIHHRYDAESHSLASSLIRASEPRFISKITPPACAGLRRSLCIPP